MPVTTLRFSLAVVLAALSTTIAAQDEAQRRDGEHFTIHFHPGGLSPERVGRLADEALAAAESVWPTLVKLLPMPDHKAIPVHVYADVQEYRDMEKKCSPHKILVESFWHAAGPAAYVLLWPHVSPGGLDKIGLPSYTADGIAFQAARGAVAGATELARDDGWFAEVVAYHVLEANTNPAGTQGTNAGYDTRRGDAYYFRRDKMPDLRTLIVEGTTPGNREDLDTQLATRALVGQLLASSGATWLRKFLAKPRQGIATGSATRVAAVETVLGSTMAKADRRFAKLCAAQEPVWHVVKPDFVRVGDRWRLIGEGKEAATASMAPRPPKGNFAIRTTVTMEAISKAEVRFQLDWDGKSLVAVSFFEGRVTLALADQQGKPTDISTVECPITLGKPFDVSLEVSDTDLRIVVDGKEAITWPYGERGMHGEWGISAGDTLVWIAGARVEPLRKKGKK